MGYVTIRIDKTTQNNRSEKNVINKNNVAEVIRKNYELLPTITNRVNMVLDKGIHFKYKPVQSIMSYLIKNAEVILFPSEALSYGGMVMYRNGNYYININTLQPKPYENFIWAHEFYHFEFEKDRIQNEDEATFINNPVLEKHERMANLFAAEMLINKELLEILFKEKMALFPSDNLETNIIRLIPSFGLPYKSLVIKLAQDGLISISDAERIIAFPYRENLPADFDLSMLSPSRAIKIDSLNNLLEKAAEQGTLLQSDLESIANKTKEHLKTLEAMRHKPKEEVKNDCD